jgi:hypothetical protein
MRGTYVGVEILINVDYKVSKSFYNRLNDDMYW